MPMLFVQTNVPVEKLPSNVNSELTDAVSSLLSKPKEYIFVSIVHVPNLTFQGTFKYVQRFCFILIVFKIFKK